MDCLSEESCRCGAEVTRQLRFDCTEIRATIPGGGGLPDKRLIGMCCWMGSHFHDWSDYNGVAFSIDLLEWGRKFSDFWGK